MEYFTKDTYEGQEFWIKALLPDWDFSPNRSDNIRFIGVEESDVNSSVEAGNGKIFESKKDLFSNINYILQRRAAYPSMAQQMDTLYHSGLEAWKASIDEVKERFPKPE